MSKSELEKYTDTWRRISADYVMTQQSRLKRKRPGVDGVGRSADYHYRRERDFMESIELARDDDRNNQIIGQGITRAVDNVLQTEFGLDSRTGHRGLDKEIEEWWKDVSESKAFSSTGQTTFFQQTKLALRSVIVDGDILGLAREDDKLQLVEAHRLRTPMTTIASNKNVIHGILFDNDGVPQEYWVTKEDINPNYGVQKLNEVNRFAAVDKESGQQQVFHLFNPKRVTQRRGFTSMAPIALPTGMLDDILIAKLVQQQTASAITILREQSEELLKYPGRNKRDKLGAQRTEPLSDGGTRVIEELACGVEVKANPGEKLTAFSAHIPNPEFFAHARLVLTVLGLNLSLPLVVFLMDASETNFSGWRGALDQGKIGWKSIQRFLKDDWYCPIYRWKLYNYFTSDKSFRARVLAAQKEAKRPFGLYRHGWNPPTWPYVQPVEDSTARILKRHGLLSSPRRLAAEDGLDWLEDIVREAVPDNFRAIRFAMLAARKLNDSLLPEEKDFMRVHWRDLLSLPMPERINMSLSQQIDSGQQQPAPQATPAKPNGNGKVPSNIGIEV